MKQFWEIFLIRDQIKRADNAVYNLLKTKNRKFRI